MKRLYTFIILSALTIVTYGQHSFAPYSIRIDTILGDCYNNSGAIITLLDANSQPIVIDDSSHCPVDPSYSELFDVQFIYQNATWSSPYYSNSGTINLDAGIYHFGIHASLRTTVGSQTVIMSLDTMIYNITISTTYNYLDASILGNYATDSLQCGNRRVLHCSNNGRIQLKILNGRFPYTIWVVDADNNDTIKTLSFQSPQYSGTDSTKYDYNKYYTIDSLPGGDFKLYIQDGCTYTVVRHHTVDELTISRLFLYNDSWDLHCEDSSLHVSFYFYGDYALSNYEVSSYLSQLRYRFITPNGANTSDTSQWATITGSQGLYIYNPYIRSYLFTDTIRPYPVVYGQDVVFQISDNCVDTIFSYPFYFSPTNWYANTYQTVMYSGDAEPAVDSCGSSQQSKTMYHIYMYNYAFPFCADPPYYWVYRDSLTHQIIKIDTVSSPTQESVTTTDEIGQFASHLPATILLNRTLYDRYGNILGSFVETITADSGIARTNAFWNYDYGSFNYCCGGGPNYFNIYELYSPFPSFRDSVVVRLVSSPVFNKYNFTATYRNGEWDIVKDDTVSNDMEISGSNMTIAMRNTCQIGGRYIFHITTSCRTDTLICDLSRTYYNYEVTEQPDFESTQLCGKLLVTPTAGAVTRTDYYMDPNISNDIPQTTTHPEPVSYFISQGITGGYDTREYSAGDAISLTIPGRYILCMRARTSCGDIFAFDTIDFVRKNLEFEKSVAVVCDSASALGCVIVKAINGSLPFTYEVYSRPDLGGVLLGTNQTGNFYNLPLTVGQEISVLVSDSCETNYHINIITTKLDLSRLVWIDDYSNEGFCEGATIHLSTAEINEGVTYLWTGPNNFVSTNRENDIYLPRGAESGYYKVTLSNTGCNYDVSDSIYIHVLPVPDITITCDSILCPGDIATVQFSPEGSGLVHFTLERFTEGQHSSYPLSCQSGNSTTKYFPIFSDNLFWIGQISDSHCAWNQPQDSAIIVVNTQNFTDTSTITNWDTHVCQGLPATISATSSLSTPYVIYWFDTETQNQLLQTDTINSEDESAHYSFGQLMSDTTLYAVVANDSHCPALFGPIDHTMNMSDGQTTIPTGLGIRLFDSGGPQSNYNNGENLSHTFHSANNDPILLTFDACQISTGDSLYIYDGDVLIGAISGNNIPTDLLCHSGSVHLRFKSDNTVHNAGWNLRILTTIRMKAVNAFVAYPVFDTISATACESDNPYSYQGFANIDVSHAGFQTIDSVFQATTGCDSTVTLMLTVLPRSETDIQETACESYIWNNETYQESGDYEQILTAANGCDSIVHLSLNVIHTEMEIISLTGDFCDHYRAELTVQGNTSDFHWSTGETADVITIEEPGTYTVTAYGNGCESTAQITIPKCEMELFLPNAITPSLNDGLNDCFYIPERQKNFIDEFAIYIYNRWGELVFSSNDKHFKWYGDFNGEIKRNTMFNYVIHYRSRIGQKFIQKGSLLIL